MTDTQLMNNTNNNNNNNNNDNFNNNYYNAIKTYNNDVEPKYLHKKFKKVATSEVVVPMEIAKEKSPVLEQTTGSSKSVIIQQDTLSKDNKKSSKSDNITTGLDCESSESRKSRYICPYCKQVCTKPSVLKKHIRSHTNERPYPCTLCNVSFKTRSNLYKHRRSRAHALKTTSGEVGKVSEDSDVSLSDSASNGTRPLSQLPELPDLEMLQIKTIKTGKIYKPKFHTAMQSINSELETSVPLNHSANSLSNNKPNVEQVQEHIDKIITDNQAIVDAVDPRLQKLMQRQQSFFDTQNATEQPVDLSPSDESTSKKRSYNQYSVQNRSLVIQDPEKSPIIMDLLLNCQSINSPEKINDTLINVFKNVSHSSNDNFDVKRVYCNEAFSASSSLSSVPSPPLKYDSQLELEINKKDDSGSQKLSEYHHTNQPLPSPGPLLGNTRLVDAYGPSCAKKLRSESISTLPSRNSVQMFGGEVRILDNSGETKTMRIEPRQTNSPSNEHNSNSQCATTETSSIVVRSGLHSGGTIVHKPPGTPASACINSSLTISNTPAISTPIIPNISTPNIAPTMTCYNYLQPLTNVNAYNPLTLPQSGLATIFHGGKIIPYVPGMPGPHSLTNTSTAHISPIQHNRISMCKVIPGIPGLHMGSQPLELESSVNVQTQSELDILKIPTSTLPSSLGNPSSPVNKESTVGSETPNSGFSNPETLTKPEDKFRSRSSSKPISPSSNVIVNRYITNQTKLTIERGSKIDEEPKNTSNELDFCTSVNSSVKRASPRSIESKKRTNQSGEICLPSSDNIMKICALNSRKKDEFLYIDAISKSESVSMDNLVVYNETKIHDRNSRENPINVNRENNSNFLRPTSLPLKPGTFVPKRHHGITPTANTENLITPDTPRPIKSYGQLFLNGHAYTYLGLKCSTKVFYCTLNRPQPMYVPQQHGLSMYSNWKICQEVSLDLELSHYDSRHRPSNYAIAHKAAENILTHSSYHPFIASSPDSGLESDPQEKLHKTTIFNTGFESNEDYIYVRGRGRGKYICKECGIRCKKPSMLNKHSRTHTDVRPYTCKYCKFSFKTKGNLTKHMKSKSHYKKCIELGTTPVPTSVCDKNIDKDAIAKLVAVGGNTEESSEEDDESDNEESEDSGTEEQEAAQSLLRLSQPNTNQLPGLLPSGRPSTYPYARANSIIVTTGKIPTITSSSVSTTSATSTIIQSVSHRYYFPSNKSISKETRDSVIRSLKLEDSDLDTKVLDEILKQQQQQLPQPIDLTLKIPDVIPTPVVSRSNELKITPVSKPVIIHAITRTQHYERKPRTDGHMLQAYLTEKHMMASKTKQQYFVAPSRCDEHSVICSDNDFTKSKNYFSGSTSSITYTDSIQMQKIFLQEKECKEACEKNIFEMKTLQSEQNLKKNESRIKKKKLNNRQEVLGTENKIKSDNKQSPIIYEKQRDCKLYYDSSANNLEFNDENRDQLTKDITNIDDKPSNRKLVGHKSHDQLQPLDIHSEEFRNTSEDLRSSEKPDIKHPIQLSNGLKHPVARKMVVASTPLGGSSKSQSEFLQPSCRPTTSYPSCSENEDGKCICNVCNKEFSKISQLKLHMNIHYFERPYKCENCSVSFRAKGHLAKHERSSSHMNKVTMTSTFGTATSSNPRPFQCTDCNVAFRIHGHLAKHLRSKMHIMKLECLCKLPFGTYAEMERSGMNMNEIDTTDCIQSTASLQIMAHKLYEQDPSNMGQWDPDMMPQGTSGGDTSSDESESTLSHQYQKLANSETAHAYHDAVTLTYTNKSKDIEEIKPNLNINSTLSFKCQICLRLLKTFDECQAHCLLEHNGEGYIEKKAESINYGDGHDENMQKRIFYARQT